MDIKKVFLDLGTHNCEGLTHFKNELNIDKSWEVHAFEPNPKLDMECLNNMNLNIDLHKAGVWIEAGTFEFKMFGKDGLSQGGYIAPIGTPEYGDFHSNTTVNCINLLEFLDQFDNDEVYIKMDIEWAEFAIIEALLNKGWKQNIKRIWIEWHGQHITEYIDKANDLKTRIRQISNTEVLDWI